MKFLDAWTATGSSDVYRLRYIAMALPNKAAGWYLACPGDGGKWRYIPAADFHAAADVPEGIAMNRAAIYATRKGWARVRVPVEP